MDRDTGGDRELMRQTCVEIQGGGGREREL